MRSTPFAVKLGLAPALALPALALALAAGPAWGAEHCLAGAAALDDQRALDSLHGAVEEACPCASYAGSASGGRAAYRTCATRVRDVAIEAGALRRECRGAATGDYAESTCGTHLVACGRFTPNARREPASCRIASPLACDGGRGFRENACAAETHCSDVVRFNAGTCVDPRDDGPFGAGVRVIPFTKQSAVDPRRPRVLETVIWYPSAKGEGEPSPRYRAVVDAPLDASRGPYPLLLFSHGSCGYPLQSTFLLPLLATHGFVVVAPPHPGNTLSEYPDCGSARAQAESYAERPNDVIFVLDRMLEASDDPASPFSGAIDPARIGMSGHSFGGFTTYLVQAREPRIRVAIPMAPAALFDPELTVPSLSLVGEVDSAVGNDLTRAAFERSSSPRYYVSIGRAGHFAFSDGCFPGPDCDPPATMTQGEAHDAVLRWVLPFLEVHLAGDASFAPFLTPGSEPAGIAFDRDR